MELVEWANHFINNLNHFKRDLISKSTEGDEIKCVYKEKGEVIYIVCPDIDEKVIERAKAGSCVIVCLNSKENLEFAVKKWGALIKNRALKIVFANPALNLQWSLLPYTHELISDRATLKEGLRSIAGSVPLV